MKKLLALILVLITVLSLAACSPREVATDDGNDGEDNGEVKTSLKIATYNDILGWFPADSDYGADKTRDGIFFQNVYETLFRISETSEIVPHLATDYSVSEDGLEWTFTLRDDVTFHNGTKFTAKDVVFTWNYALTENPTMAASQLNGLKAVEYVDDTHFKAILSKVTPAFLNMCCTQVSGILCEEYFNEVGLEGYVAQPVGTAAYEFVSWTSGEKLVLKAYEGYWGEAPAIKDVEVVVINNVNTQFISLEAGDVDVVINANLASCSRIVEDASITWDNTASTTRTLIQFGWKNEWIREDLNLRLAIASAIRREEYLQGVLYGYGKILDCDVVTGFPSSPEAGTYTVIPYDQDKAKEYLAASDYDGREIECYVVTGGTPESVAKIMQAQLTEVGINMKVVPCDSATWMAAMRASESPMTIYDNTNIWFDFCNPGASYNPDLVKTYKPEEYFGGATVLKDYYTKLASEQDPVARKQLMADLMSYNNENAYQIGLYAGVNAVAYNKALSGIKASPVADFYIQNVSWN